MFCVTPEFDQVLNEQNDLCLEGFEVSGKFFLYYHQFQRNRLVGKNQRNKTHNVLVELRSQDKVSN